MLCNLHLTTACGRASPRGEAFERFASKPYASQLKAVERRVLMKKIIAITGVVLIALSCVLISLYAIDHIKMKNNMPVFFSTWGKDYTSPEGITPEEAVESAKQLLDDKSKKEIENFENPKVEEVVFSKAPGVIYRFNKKTRITGRRLYKITFHTFRDGLLGPIVFYVDKICGEVVGMDYRE